MTGQDLIKAEEGLRLEPYKDTKGLLTIGYGRCLDRKGISRDEAEFMFNNDYAEALQDVLTRLPWTKDLNEPRLAVLVSMRYQMGMTGLLGFKRALAAIQGEAWMEARRHLLDSKWARDDSPNRAWRHAMQMATGEWMTP